MKVATIPYIGVGVYTVPEAARLADIPAQRLRRWLLGYTYKHDGKERFSPPVWDRELDDWDDGVFLGFRDLMEARFVDVFCKHSVSLHAIRRAAAKASQLFGSDHPMSCRRFRTDGRTVFAEVASETGEIELLDLVKSQYAFKKVLAPYLYSGVDFVDDEPVRWHPPSGNRHIVVDPKRAFGKPILEKSGTPTEVVAANFEAGDSIEVLARLYGESVQATRAAIDFESKPAA